MHVENASASIYQSSLNRDSLSFSISGRREAFVFIASYKTQRSLWLFVFHIFTLPEHARQNYYWLFKKAF